eukprot:142799-Chlamydomonas_euryale.AAC.1
MASERAVGSAREGVPPGTGVAPPEDINKAAVPAGSIHCVERRHACHAPHMQVHGSGGQVEQPKVLPRNGGAHRAGE